MESSITTNVITDNSLFKDRECAGKNCNRRGIYKLKIIYINKIAYFCNICANDLIKSEIAVKATDEVEAEAT